MREPPYVDRLHYFTRYLLTKTNAQDTLTVDSEYNINTINIASDRRWLINKIFVQSPHLIGVQIFLISSHHDNKHWVHRNDVYRTSRKTSGVPLFGSFASLNDCRIYICTIQLGEEFKPAVEFATLWCIRWLKGIDSSSKWIWCADWLWVVFNKKGLIKCFFSNNERTEKMCVKHCIEWWQTSFQIDLIIKQLLYLRVYDASLRRMYACRRTPQCVVCTLDERSRSVQRGRWAASYLR